MPPQDEQGAVPIRSYEMDGRCPVSPPVAEAIIPFDAEDLPQAAAFAPPARSEVLRFEPRPWATPIRRILVMKLDHFGDFIISLPALRDLRETFPQAHIRMVCGGWNEQIARDCGVIDEVCCYDYFPESVAGWNGKPVDDMAVFERAVQGAFDLAIDLRVDEDTRHLLARVNARLRCGVGSRSRFPLLDIALPGERSRPMAVLGTTGSSVFLPPAHFASALSGRTPLYHEGPLPGLNGVPFIHGPLPPLPPGELKAAIGLSVHRFLPGIRGCSLAVEIIREGEQLVADQVLGRTSLGRLGRAPLVLEFHNSDAGSRFELRIRASGKFWAGTLRFAGIHIVCGAMMPLPRFPPVELHVGETLSLLIALIRQRTTQIYRGPAIPSRRPANRPIQIVFAPFSNSSTRNWPIAYYTRLAALLLERTDCEITLIGTGPQLVASRRISDHNMTPRLRNLTGRTTWTELSALLSNSDLVICNNSGIAHLAASLGSRVLAIYSGSHQPQEWGPRGPLSHAVMQRVPCSPCGFEQIEDCTHEHACMRMITPEYLLERVLELVECDRDLAPRTATQQAC